MGRILALDLGSSRTGLAISDEEKIISQALPFTVTLNELEETVRNLNQEYSFELMLVGLPKTLDGSEGSQAVWTKKIAERISQAVGLPVVFLDERLTSKQAFHFKNDTSVPLDSLAAQKLMETYLKIQKNNKRQ